MTGLEYICGLYNKKYIALAEEIGVSKQEVNMWAKGNRAIPKKHLPTIAEIFDLPEEYFQKEIEEIDKLKIQKMKLSAECKDLNIDIQDL